MASSPQFSVQAAIDRLMSKDRDFRFMALSDLLNELQKDQLKIDPDAQRRLSNLVLQLLQDPSSEVQSLSMKCLPSLAQKIATKLTVEMVERLLHHLTHKIDENRSAATDSDSFGPKTMRDVSFMALRSLVLELDPGSNAGREVVVQMTPHLLNGLKTNPDIHLECLELLNEILARYGLDILSFHERLTAELLLMLDHQRQQCRKRATACLSVLTVSCSRALFETIVEHLRNALESASAPRQRHTTVQTFSAICKASAARLAAHLGRFVPTLLGFSTSEEFAEDIELREHCLQAFEALVSRCADAVSTYIDSLVDVVALAIKFDPNYAVSDDDDDDEDRTMDDDTEEMDDDDEGFSDYSDDDDSSWKVRRAAVRLSSAIVNARVLSPPICYFRVGRVLIARFKEREEAVRLDIYATFIEILQLLQGEPQATENDMAVEQTDTERTSDFRAELHARGQSILRVIKKELSSRSVKARARALSLLAALIRVVPQATSDQILEVAAVLESSLQDQNTNVKLEVLALLQAAITVVSIPSVAQLVIRLMPQILQTAKDRYYRVTAEALGFCSRAVEQFGAQSDQVRQSLEPLIVDIYKSAHARLMAPDQDSEVRENALACIGYTVATYGDQLGPLVNEASEILLDRMQNEVTRISAVRALGVVGQSKFSSCLATTLKRQVNVLGAFLRKNDRNLRQAALETLLVLAPVVPKECDTLLLGELTSQVRDEDMKLAALSLSFCAEIARERGPSLSRVIAETVYPNTLVFAVSPLLQGQALAYLLDFMSVLGSNAGAPLESKRIVHDLLSSVSSTADATLRTGARTVARCVAALCRTAKLDRVAIVENLVSETSDVRSETSKRVLALTCLAELGRESLLGEDEGSGRVHQAVLSCLDSPVEDVKAQGAVTLGAVASGNRAAGIQNLISLVREHPEMRYLLLVALREAIANASTEALKTSLSELLPLLLDISATLGESTPNAGEESVRIAAAECLGLLAVVDPAVVVPTLQQACDGGQAGLRATAALSIKYAVSSQGAQVVDNFLRPSLSSFLNLIKDKEVVVRRGGVICLGSLARLRPSILKPYLGETLPLLYEQCIKKKELVRTVDLGPFKYTEDDGLELRKSAFECMGDVLSHLGDSVDLKEYVKHLSYGLSDHSDVKSIAHVVMVNVASFKNLVVILPCLPDIIGGLRGTLTFTPKPNAVRQEIERHEDAVRGALRVVRAFEKVPAVSSQEAFVDFMDTVVRSDRLFDKYESLVRDVDSVHPVTWSSRTMMEM